MKGDGALTGRAPTEHGNGYDFVVGDAVVSPGHGVGTVVERRVRVLAGARREYLTIDVEPRALRLMIPTESSARVRLRRPASHYKARRALSALAAPPRALDGNWRMRQQEATSVLATGKLVPVAELVRDLAHGIKGRPQSKTDRDLCRRARELLEAELGAVLGKTPAEVEDAIDKRLALAPSAAAR